VTHVRDADKSVASVKLPAKQQSSIGDHFFGGEPSDRYSQSADKSVASDRVAKQALLGDHDLIEKSIKFLNGKGYLVGFG